MNVDRRAFLGLLAAPAVVSAANIMPVRSLAWLWRGPTIELTYADLPEAVAHIPINTHVRIVREYGWLGKPWLGPKLRPARHIPDGTRITGLGAGLYTPVEDRLWLQRPLVVAGSGCHVEDMYIEAEVASPHWGTYQARLHPNG